MRRTIQIEIDADAGGDRCQSCHLRVPNLAGKHFCVAFDGVELVQIGVGRFERLDACRAAEIAPTSEADERRKVLEEVRSFARERSNVALGDRTRGYNQAMTDVMLWATSQLAAPAKKGTP